MKKSSSQKAIFYLWFLVVLALILTYSWAKAQVDPALSSSGKTLRSRKEGVNPKEANAEKIKYTSQHLRDPFKSLFETPEKPEIPEQRPTVRHELTHLQVQGMVWGTVMPQAIINNKVVRVGEIVEGAEILSIGKEGIEVLYGGRKYFLRPISPFTPKEKKEPNYDE